MSAQHCRKLLRQNLTTAQRMQLLRIQPNNINIQKSRRVQKCLVRISRRDHIWSAAPLPAPDSKKKHRPDALAGSRRGIECRPCPKQLSSIFLALRYDPLCLIKSICSRNLCDVIRLTAEKRLSLCPGI